jgi:hypothetical protein
MLASGQAFFGGPVVDRIVRNGADARLSSARLTYTEMLLQVARDYPGLPDPRTLAIGEIVFFYNGLRDELKRHTKPKTPPPKPPRRPKHG